MPLKKRVFVFTYKELCTFMNFVWFYQPKGKKNWKANCIRAWQNRGSG